MAARTRVRFYARLAIKNLARYKKRTAVTASAIALGVMMVVGLDSMFQDFFASSDRNYKWYEVGSAAVAGRGYWDEKDRYPLDTVIDDAAGVLATLDNAGITAAPRIDFRGELIVRYDPFPEDGSVNVVLQGVDVERDPDVFRIAESVENGRYLRPDEDGALIGGWLADRLGAEVGYPITVTTRTRDGFHQLMDLEIVGIFRTSNPTVDRTTIFLPLEAANYYLEMDGAVTRIVVSLPERLPGRADLTPFRDAISRHPEADRLEVLDFATLTAEFADVVEITNGFSQLMLMLLAVIAIVGISNTMLMAVMEREREIGMLRALGMRNREIKTLFAFEAAGIGVLGAIGGVVLSALFVWFLVEIGIDYGPLMEGIELDYRWDGVLRGVWNPGTMIASTVFAAFVAGVVSVLPTRRILKRQVSESLRRA